MKYRWDIAIVVLPGKPIAIELTNANAIVDSTGRPPSTPTSQEPSAEGTIYERAKNGVVRINVGLAHGSGFCADTLGGVILTNDHVIQGSGSIYVIIDSVTRVRAQLLARDADADLAVLRVAPDACASCPRLHLSSPQPGTMPVQPGERVIAIGYPLNQERTLTAGIASSIREGAIISDVNINHGNSGGPLLNLRGEVVAINTFSNLSSAGGPGISGSIIIGRSREVLQGAADALRTEPPPDASRLPTPPFTSYPVAALLSIADTSNSKIYRQMADIDVGRFTLAITTPVMTYVLHRLAESEVSGERVKREQKAGVNERERYSEMKNFRDWDEYVGDARIPVIAITANPDAGETGGSFFARLMLGPRVKADYKFKGDVSSITLYRNSTEIVPLLGGHAPLRVLIDNAWVSLKDVADFGYNTYDPSAFAPEDGGAVARLTVAITDLKNPKDPTCAELSPEIVARAWNDFEALHRLLNPNSPFLRANPKKHRVIGSPNWRALPACKGANQTFSRPE